MTERAINKQQADREQARKKINKNKQKREMDDTINTHGHTHTETPSREITS
jgi:hypothetical protein